MRIIVIGGYGNFGARVCRALAYDAGLEVYATGRSLRETAPAPNVRNARLDIESEDFPAVLRALAPAIVIHCAGPYQGQDYKVAAASCATGAHYIDLSDGREFVARFAESNDMATRVAGRLAVSGASTLPALSSAVVDSLASRFSSIEEIQISIAPGQRAPRGAATIAGVLSYAGNPFRWLSGGRWKAAYGWQELKRLRFAGLGSRWAAACDVPDLELLPARYPSVRTVEFRAALELGIQHFALWAVAGLRRVGVPLPIERWARMLNRVASLLDPLGSARGGMLVRVAGVRTTGARGRVEWHLTADDNHGPEIPCIAAILVARKLARGELILRGAHPCMGMLCLDEFEREFARWNITTAVEEYSA